MCKLGTIRPPGSLRCISTLFWPKISKEANCTELIDDVNLLYGNHYRNETSHDQLKALITNKKESDKTSTSIVIKPKNGTMFRDDPPSSMDETEIDTIEKRHDPLPSESDYGQNEDANVYQVLKDVDSCDPDKSNSCPGILIFGHH
jgi:hypothetical protein